jgi:hypothetical protein
MNNRTLGNKIVVVLSAALLLALALPAQAQFGPPGNAAVVQPLTAAETDWLKFMREEEKLARDLYQQLYQKWNLVIFRNISASEQAHFNTIGVLVARYGIPDPAQSAPGVYSDARLNALYNDLLARGMRSAQDALEIGTLVEKKDIADLEAALKETAKPDIKRVYANLMNASYNHLEAFETVCTLATAPAAAN